MTEFVRSVPGRSSPATPATVMMLRSSCKDLAVPINLGVLYRGSCRAHNGKLAVRI